MKSPRPPSRTLRWSLLAAVLALGVGGIVAAITAERSLKKAPAAYLIATSEETVVRVGWKTRKLTTVLSVSANTAVSIPAEKTVAVVYPDGRQEIIKGPARIQVPTSPPSELEFLAAPLNRVPNKLPEAEVAGGSLITVTCPVGVTRFLDPTIAWTTNADTLYDVAIVDPADESVPPRVAHRVRPPIRVSSLQSKQGPKLPADRILTVLIRVAGETELGGSSQFLTAQNANADELPPNSAELLTEALSALIHIPARTGDAWVALSKLPEIWQHSELAIRLRLKVSADLGLTDEIRKLNTELGRGI